MIEMMLEAERRLAVGLLDQAEGLYRQVIAADPRNAIAVVGLARVLRRRGDTAAARELLAHALEIDPDEAAARRLLAELNAEAAPAAEEAPAPVAPAAAPVETGPPTSPAQPRGLVAWLRRLFRPG